MSKHDYQDYEELEEVTIEKIKRNGGRKPKKSWAEINKQKQRKLAKKEIAEKRKSSEKNAKVEEDD